MSVSRLSAIPGIGVDKMGNAADADGRPEMLRLENLDTDIAPPPAAIEATLQAVKRDDANSYLPFFGIHALRNAAAERLSQTTGIDYDPETQCIVSAGGLSGVLNTLLALIEPGDEVVITDPAYAGLLNRIRLAGGIPRLVPLVVTGNHWRLDLNALHDVISLRTKIILTMSPSMPSGLVHTHAEWQAITEAAQRADAWILHDAAMERILFTEDPVLHPASFDGMAERVITAGSVSKEYRMIGWRIGWVVGPKSIMNDIGLVSLSNVVCQVGITMPGAAAALTTENDGVAAATAEWKARRDIIVEELHDLPVVIPDGGWSLLVDTVALGMTPDRAAERLFHHGAIASTPMIGWGHEDQAGRYLRFVFSNEPVERLGGLRERIRQSWSL